MQGSPNFDDDIEVLEVDSIKLSNPTAKDKAKTYLAEAAVQKAQEEI